MKKHLTYNHIICDGGIGNRMNSLIAGLILSNKINRVPIVYWPLNNWCDCPFEDLFECNINLSSEDINYVFANNLDSYFMIINNPTVHKDIKYLDFSENSINFLNNNKKDVVYMNNKLPDIFVKADCYRVLQSLPVKKEIVDHVKEFVTNKKISTNVHAVHIRLTDNTKQVDVNFLFDQIQQNPNIRYFVCSDDKSTELKFNKLPNVEIHEKNNYVEKLVEGSWNETIKDKEGRSFNFNVNRSRNSIIEALQDVLILSKCNLSNKQAKSTFYQLAKFYAGVNF